MGALQAPLCQFATNKKTKVALCAIQSAMLVLRDTGPCAGKTVRSTSATTAPSATSQRRTGEELDSRKSAKTAKSGAVFSTLSARRVSTLWVAACVRPTAPKA